ncbi:UNVERIFIED_CONTAM: putative receptor-like protein kinase [Sesamum latifolium]|uniref:Receptor-like protein kinase n=1 Tax=Sesamum latifolium TaxID=2727402 RepID=A0AAW2YG09_9LAMI
MYQMGGASREVGPDNVYNTARVIKSSDDSIPNGNLTWLFRVEKGYSYMVRMHFCDIASVASGMLYFNVYVNGNLAYENLDLSDVTNRLLASPFYADFLVDGNSSGNLVVSVGPSNMSLPRAVDAILNGVERYVFFFWGLRGFVWRSWRRGQEFCFSSGCCGILVAICVCFLQWRKSGAVAWSRCRGCF